MQSFIKFTCESVHSQFPNQRVINGHAPCRSKTEGYRPFSIVIGMAIRIGNVFPPSTKSHSLTATDAFSIESRTAICHLSPKICFLPSCPCGGGRDSLSEGIQKRMAGSSVGSSIALTRIIHEYLLSRLILSPAGLFPFGLLNRLPVRLRRPYLREATAAGFGLDRLATAFMNNPG